MLPAAALPRCAGRLLFPRAFFSDSFPGRNPALSPEQGHSIMKKSGLQGNVRGIIDQK
jgi:hypothetical protein